MASISSSQKGGFASNEPLMGKKSRQGLKGRGGGGGGALAWSPQPRCLPQQEVKGSVQSSRHCHNPAHPLRSGPQPHSPPLCYSPPGSEIAICVQEGRAVLLEVAVQGGGKALEGHAKKLVEGFKDMHWKCPLEARSFVEPNAKHHLRRPQRKAPPNNPWVTKLCEPFPRVGHPSSTAPPNL